METLDAIFRNANPGPPACSACRQKAQRAAEHTKLAGVFVGTTFLLQFYRRGGIEPTAVNATAEH